MINDYVLQLKKEIEEKNWNRYRFNTEPSEFFDALWAELDAWEAEGTFDVFKKTFKSEYRWHPMGYVQTQWRDFANGKPIICQWILRNGGLEMEFAAARLKKPQMRNTSQ